MTIINIRFLDAEEPNAVLGTEVSTDIDICELPSDPEGKHIFIRKKFTSSDYNYWKVEKIDTTQDTDSRTIDCDITLSSLKYLPKSVSEKHSTNGSKLIRGRILECDFGHFSQDISVNAAPSTTVRNFNSRLPFEMVKRRLVVVVSNKEDPALVVPLSKGDKAKDKRTVVKVTSLPENLVTFNEPICYAKTSAISYVSGHRLFPIRYMDGEKRQYDNRIEKKLSNEDVIEIKKAIFTAVGGDNILKSIQDHEVSINTLREEISLKNKELDEKIKEIDNLMDMLDKHTQ